MPTWMCYDCQLAVSLLDLEFGGISLDPQRVVVGGIDNHDVKAVRKDRECWCMDESCLDLDARKVWPQI